MYDLCSFVCVAYGLGIFLIVKYLHVITKIDRVPDAVGGFGQPQEGEFRFFEKLCHPVKTSPRLCACIAEYILLCTYEHVSTSLLYLHIV